MKIRLFGVILVLSLAATTWAQIQKRLHIPGAIPIGSVGIDRPLPLRRLQQQPQYQAVPAAARLRRPIPNAIPAPLPQIRPVVEEPDDLPQSSLNLNDEAAKLSSIPLPSGPRQQLNEEDDDDEEPPQPKYIQPVQFRPERPPIQIAQPVRAPPQPVRQQAQPVRQAPVRQVSQPARRPQPQYAEEDNVPRQDRRRKPEVKILRKYRDDNPDGSITWGFENDDGTFKEENIGIDCITRGKYGYIDPDGNRREYSYETGLKCDEPELEEEPLQQPAPGKNYKRPPPQQPIRLQ